VSIDLIARTVRGIEYVAADELSALAPSGLMMAPRQLTFSLPSPDPRLLDLRTVDDLFQVVGTVAGIDHRKDALPRLARGAAELDWDVAGRRRFDVVASLAGRRNYSRYDVEDAVGSALSRLGEYVSRRSGQVPPTDLTVRAFLDDPLVTLAVRYADAPLHRRAYKQDASRGTLHPPMAAALARLVGMSAGETALDPFCGDGTIPIELSLYCPAAQVHGSDLDPARIRNAEANARRAGVAVTFTVADAGALDEPVDALVTNPPWNLAVDTAGLLTDGLAPFWRTARARRLAVLMDAELEPSRLVRSAGYDVALEQSVRLAGRLSRLVLCTPAGAPGWQLPEPLANARLEAQRLGLVTETGFA
jgi:tRNA (guanine6-N2)-methyltransferase